MSISLQALPNPNDALFSGRVDIAKAHFSIGRASDNDWIVSDAKRMVSKHHCVIEKISDGYRLVDRSTNGVAVNGKPVDRNSGHMLRNGDEIELAQYRFRVEMRVQNRPGSRSDAAPEADPSKPRITAILHDVAAGGVGATGQIPGRQDDLLDRQSAKGQGGARARIAAQIGWDGPPPKEPEVVRPADVIEPRDRELVNRVEQMPTDRLRIELPKPQQIIPDDWYDNGGDNKGSDTGPLPEPGNTPVGSKPLNIIPVENIDLTEPAMPASSEWIEPSQPELYATVARTEPTAPTPAATYPAQQVRDRSTELLNAFCDGASINNASLSDADLVRFFHNAGRVLTIAVAELQALQIAKTRVAALLETGDGDLGYTPWIFSLSGEDRSRATQAIADFMRDAEPRDMEPMRKDFEEVRVTLENLASGIISFAESLQQAVSAGTLEKHVPTAAKALPALRKAALWDAFVEHSGLFDPKNPKGQVVDILKLLKRDLSKKNP